MQPQAHYHSSQHARPQSTPAHEQINKKITALASGAAHLRVTQAKRKTTQSSESLLASSQLDSAAASFQNHFGSAWPTPSLAAHGAFGEQPHCWDSSWPVGGWEDGILHRRCSGPHHLQVFLMNLAPEDSHTVQLTNSLTHSRSSTPLHAFYPSFKLNHGLGQQDRSLLRLPTSCICKALFSRDGNVLVLWSFKSKSGGFLLRLLGWASQRRAETAAHCSMGSFGPIILTLPWMSYGKLLFKSGLESQECVCHRGELGSFTTAIVWSSKDLLF